MDRWTEKSVLDLIDAYEERGWLDPPMAEAARKYVDRGRLNRAFALLMGAEAADSEPPDPQDPERRLRQ